MGLSTASPSGATRWQVDLTCDICGKTCGRVVGLGADDMVMDSDAGWVEERRAPTTTDITTDDGGVMTCSVLCPAAEASPLVCSDACEVVAMERYPVAERGTP